MEAGKAVDQTARAVTGSRVDLNLSALIPHPDAESFWARHNDRNREDQKAIESDVAQWGILEPISVIQRDGSALIIDGVSRFLAATALLAGGDTRFEQVPCVFVQIPDERIRDYILSKNAMRHRLATGQRILRYIENHKHQVLEAWGEGKDKVRSGAKCGKKPGGCVSDTGFDSVSLSARLGVSNKDILKGIELLASVEQEGLPQKTATGSVVIVPFLAGQGDKAENLTAIYNSVLVGETPIRRWQAAFGGRVTTEDKERPATNYGRIFVEAAKSLGKTGELDIWAPLAPETKKEVYEFLHAFVLDAPDDLVHVIKDTLKARDGGASTKKRG